MYVVEYLTVEPYETGKGGCSPSFLSVEDCENWIRAVLEASLLSDPSFYSEWSATVYKVEEPTHFDGNLDRRIGDEVKRFGNLPGCEEFK